MDRIVVVGAGLAGLRAAEELRRHGFDGDLTVVGDEPSKPYTRPPLSKQLLAGDMHADDLGFDCEAAGASWVVDRAAARLDTDRRVVGLADGEELPYDGLVIATGRRAREWPDLPALDGFFYLRSLADSIALREAVEADVRVAVVGAGFVGSEVAATLRGRGVPVTLIELGAHPMPALGPEAGRFAARVHAEHGVDLRLGAAVEGFEGTGRVEAVHLAGDPRIEADVVLLSIGSRPNTEWLHGSGLALHQGAVVCDERCAAEGHDRIVAAGDVAAWRHPHASGPVWVEHWTHASEMGRAAARNLLTDPSERQVFCPVPTFWSDQYDLKIKSVGFFGLATSTSVVEDDGEQHLVVEGHRDGQLLGAVTSNRNRAFIDYRRTLAASLSDFKTA